jgi:hypothetical protein
MLRIGGTGRVSDDRGSPDVIRDAADPLGLNIE